MAGGDFHDLLKATALTLPAPLQLMREERTGIPSRTNGQPVRPLQDEATRAWNLHTAVYDKAGGTPWRMQRHSSDLATCYVGVSFYRSANGIEMHTAVAQVFNERGDGVVVRGGTAQISKTGRQPHLTLSDARQLLLDALNKYRTTHGHQPARIVVHKTSNFTAGEIDHADLLWIQRRGAPRLYRAGQLRHCAAPASNWTRVPCSCTPAAHTLLPDLPRPVRYPAATHPARNTRYRPAHRQHRHPRPDQNELEQRPTRRTRPPHPAHLLPSRLPPQTRPDRGAHRRPLRLIHVELRASSLAPLNLTGTAASSRQRGACTRSPRHVRRLLRHLTVRIWTETLLLPPHEHDGATRQPSREPSARQRVGEPGRLQRTGNAVPCPPPSRA